MKKNKWIQITAFLALFAIVIWIIWTWLIIIFDSSSSGNQALTTEQYEELMKQFNSENTWSIEIQTWNIDNQSWIEIWTWNIEIN